ncbi:MAG: AAA family ATPase [Chloroflexi bacterium]|nr:AAA family ATPase [Chloroflexota bacterium]
MTTSTLAVDLNAMQRRAVEWVDGPLLIVAGPGSGKTRVITHRIAHLIRRARVSPFQIAAVTFTNKAAREMVERTSALLDGEIRGLTVGTFHAVCARVLRRDGEPIGVNPNFTIYDDTDQMAIVREELKNLNLDDRRFPPRGILGSISRLKTELKSPEQAARAVGSYWDEIVVRVYRGYQDALRRRNALDFDDILIETVRLFHDQVPTLEHYQERYHHVMVDEFQDTNAAQYDIVRLLSGKHRNLCVVGDEDQSVYSWRGANYRNLLDFERDFPDAGVVMLEQNYRSTRNIIDAAQAIIAPNTQRKAKRLWTDNGRGEPLRIFEAYDEDQEAAFLVNDIQRQVTQGRTYRDFAVLYRTNAQSRAVEKALVRYRIPHTVVGVRFFERKEIKDVLCYLRLVHNPADDAALERVLNVPPRGIGDKSVTEIGRAAAERGIGRYALLQNLTTLDSSRAILTPRAQRSLVEFAGIVDRVRAARSKLDVARLLDLLLKESGYEKHLRDGTPEGEERWLNVQELGTVANQYAGLDGEAGLAAFLEETALVSDTDGVDETNDAVSLITFHAAKGLEFPVVYMIGMEEGISPHSRSFENEEQMEEERRLAYVAVTRARERLSLVYAARRALFGSAMRNAPSRFLLDIPRQVARGPGLGEVAVSRRAPAIDVRESDGTANVVALQEPSFGPGDRVHHAKFGEGIVVSAVLAKGDEEITVAFPGIGVKKLLQSYAGLVKR